MSSMRSNKAPGFSYVEAAISIAIVGIISVAAYYNLRSSRMTDELRTAARVVAADLRSMQARALHGQNLKWCLDTSAAYSVCEDSAAACAVPADCLARPSGGYGAHFVKNSDAYDLYSVYTTGGAEWRRVNAGQTFISRVLSKSGAPNTSIVSLQGTVPFDEVDVAFQRQNGNMRINACSACTEQSFLNVQVRHAISLKTITVSLNQYTGRISIEE